MLNRKDKEIMSRPAPPEGDTEENGGLHGLSNPPWEVNGLNHTLGFLVWGEPSTRRTSPLTWFENQWDWQWVYKKSRLCSWRVTYACLLLKKRWRKKNETVKVSDRFPMATTDWMDRPLWPLLLTSVAPHKGEECHDQGECATVGHRVGSDPAQHLNRVRKAITGAQKGTRSGAVQSPDWYPRTIPVSTLAHNRMPTLQPLAPALLPSWANVPERSSHSKWTKPAQTQTSWFLVQQLGTHLHLH